MADKPAINNLFSPIMLYKEEAKKAMTAPRMTDLYSTGDPMIDEYLGGGIGRKEGKYEIVLIFGDTGVNKSTFATQLAVTAALSGAQVSYYSLEDDRIDLCSRILRQLSGMKPTKFDDETKLFDQISPYFSIAPDCDGYTLDMLVKQVEQLFLTGSDIVVIDPLQFVFEASVDERPETEFNRQRKFMRQVNNLIKNACKETGKSKTLILVSHTNKGKFDNAIDTIMGSGANKQVPTKIIQVVREDNLRFLNMVKTRFTKYRPGRHQVGLDENTMLIRTAPIPHEYQSKPAEWWDMVRGNWDGRSKSNGGV